MTDSAPPLQQRLESQPYARPLVAVPSAAGAVPTTGSAPLVCARQLQGVNIPRVGCYPPKAKDHARPIRVRE